MAFKLDFADIQAEGIAAQGHGKKQLYGAI